MSMNKKCFDGLTYYLEKARTDPSAAYTAAIMLGNKNSPANAQIFMELAAKQGHIPAMVELGKSFMRGSYTFFDVETGTTHHIQDSTKAAYWLCKAASAKDPVACHLFARCLSEGVGVERNTGRAQFYLQWAPATPASLSIYRAEEVICFGNFHSAKHAMRKTA